MDSAVDANIVVQAGLWTEMFLWATLTADMGHQPHVGWNLSTTYGPVHLFQEEHSNWHRLRGQPLNEGHHFVSANKTLVAYTRCWGWRQGFPDRLLRYDLAENFLTLLLDS